MKAMLVGVLVVALADQKKVGAGTKVGVITGAVMIGLMVIGGIASQQ